MKHRIVNYIVVFLVNLTTFRGIWVYLTFSYIIPDINGYARLSLDYYSIFRYDNLYCAGVYRLDGRHVVFGKVISGMDVVYKVEAEGTQSGTPKRKVVIVDSGELPL